MDVEAPLLITSMASEDVEQQLDAPMLRSRQNSAIENLREYRTSPKIGGGSHMFKQKLRESMSGMRPFSNDDTIEFD